MFGVSLKEVQSYVDKKFDRLANLYGQDRSFYNRDIQSLQSKLNFTKARMKKLEDYLGVEYSETCTKGFSKIKKTTKKKK